jgi:hypothetical protein
VNALHDDDNRADARIVEARQQRVREPLVRAGALGFGKGVDRLQRV